MKIKLYTIKRKRKCGKCKDIIKGNKYWVKAGEEEMVVDSGCLELLKRNDRRTEK